MLKRIFKAVPYFLIICLLSTSVFASVPVSSEINHECDYEDCFDHYCEEFDVHFEAHDDYLDDILALIPYGSSSLTVQNEVRQIHPNAVVLEISEIRDMKDIEFALAKELKFNNGGSLEQILNNKDFIKVVTAIQDNDVEGFVIIWLNEETNEVSVVLSLWCTLCAMYVTNPWFKLAVDAIFQAVVVAIFWYTVKTFYCALEHLLSQERTLDYVEYAPTCGNCATSNHMWWNNYWWCTRCDQPAT